MSAAFEFNSENKGLFEAIVKRYPDRRGALLPALHLAHEQVGYISPEAEEFISRLLDVPLVDVREVVTFYTLFFQRPMGRHHIRLCMSISCWVRGCESVRDHLAERIGVEEGSVSADGGISWEAVPDCLGACELAPMLQLDGYFHGNLTPEKVNALLESLNHEPKE